MHIVFILRSKLLLLDSLLFIRWNRLQFGIIFILGFMCWHGIITILLNMMAFILIVSTIILFATFLIARWIEHYNGLLRIRWFTPAILIVWRFLMLIIILIYWWSLWVQSLKRARSLGLWKRLLPDVLRRHFTRINHFFPLLERTNLLLFHDGW